MDFERSCGCIVTEKRGCVLRRVWADRDRFTPARMEAVETGWRNSEGGNGRDASVPPLKRRSMSAKGR